MMHLKHEKHNNESGKSIEPVIASLSQQHNKSKFYVAKAAQLNDNITCISIRTYNGDFKINNKAFFQKIINVMLNLIDKIS
jgi:hypothetical protein